ncbi:MAG: hypothetical protein AB7J32_09640 [Pseudonocardia sp.]
MTERDGGPVDRPVGNAGEEPAETADALTALRSIWDTGRQSGADLDEARPKGKVCRNMKNIGFGGIGGGDVGGSTAGPVGEDMRSAWRELLRREGKFRPGASATSAGPVAPPADTDR